MHFIYILFYIKGKKNAFSCLNPPVGTKIIILIHILKRYKTERTAESGGF